MGYAGRPGISPALAALVAMERVRRGHRILDVGCGTGHDLLLLARWGFRHLVGVDPDAHALARARRRATRARLGRRVTFHQVAGERLVETFGPEAFDVVLHTLVANNLTKQHERHFREVAKVLRPEGQLVLHERVTKRLENARPDHVRPLPALRRHFVLTPGISTHLAEHPADDRAPAYARVVLWLGRPRRSA